MNFKWKKITSGAYSERLPAYELFVEGRKNRVAKIWRQSNSGTTSGLRYSAIIDFNKDGYNGRFGPQIWYSLSDAKKFVEKYYGLRR